MTVGLAHGGLRMPDQRDHVGRGRVTEVDHDVRVDVRDLGVPDAEPLEAALIDESAGADPLDLLEDRAGARMPLEPGMPSAAPAQVLLHDAVHDGGIAALELERGRKDYVAPVVQDGVVVSELHVRRVDGPARALLAEQLRRPEHLGDEYRALSLRRGREEMQILPDRAAHRARDADVMLEPGPPTSHRFGDDLGHHGAALDPELPVLAKAIVRSDVSNHETAKAFVGDEHVGAQAEHEIRNLGLARG